MTPEPPDFSRLIDARRSSPNEPESSALRRSAAAGEHHRLRRAVYRSALESLDELPAGLRRGEERRRFLEEAAAVGLTRRGPIIFSGETAQRIHGFPTIGSLPKKVELLEPLGSTRRNAFGVTVHTDSFRSEDVEPWGEFFVTTPARTIADLAKWQPRTKAVAALDFALNASRAAPGQRVTKPEVEAALEASAALRHRPAAQSVIEFGTDESGSVGESVSRVLIDDFGFPAPVLQVRHPAPPGMGRWFFTDFEWPEQMLIGEFDGFVKFSDPRFLNGRDPARAVFDEKRREDALRAAGFVVVRWTWDHLRAPILLRDLLVAHGLRPRRANRHFGRPW